MVLAKEQEVVLFQLVSSDGRHMYPSPAMKRLYCQIVYKEFKTNVIRHSSCEVFEMKYEKRSQSVCEFGQVLSTKTAMTL